MNKSIWNEFKEKPTFERLKDDIDCDVLVIGGGMAGILTAYFLAQSNINVVLAEARSIGEGITQNTTAVLTAQHDTFYTDLIKMHGEKVAKAYLHANIQAVETFREMSGKIDCDFETAPSYMYSMKNDLAYEVDALQKLGYNAELTHKTELPFDIKSAVKFPNMAQFHPLKFLYEIAKGLTIYENTFINKIKDHTAFTENNKIRFKQSVVATHFPFINRSGLFFAKMYQERSYVVALETDYKLYGTYNDDTTDGYYWRSYDGNLLIGKGAHRPGEETKAIEELDDFVKKYFPDAKIKCKWSNQDCVTLDNIPYVGKYGRLKDVFTITGFNLWGMSGSMVGAKILNDTLCGKENEFASAFRTNRSMLRTQLFSNLGTFTLNLLKPKLRRCPHLGCALIYNKYEHSWDCSCHGSRFDKDGKLIDNPATDDAKV